MNDVVSPAPASPAPGAEPPAPALSLPEPVGSIIGEAPKEEPTDVGSIIGEAPKEPPKEEPKGVPKEAPKEVEGPPPGGKYEFKLPEGVELEPEALAEASKFMAEELKLSPAAAQKLLDYHLAGLQAEAEGPYRLWEATQRQWQKEVMADPLIGGDNLANVKVKVAKLLDQYGYLDVKEKLYLTGAGSEKSIVGTLYKIAEVLTEGTFVPGGSASGGTRTVEQVLFPTMFKEGQK